MPKHFAKQILIAVLAYLALGGGLAWAERSQRSDPRDGDLPASVRRIQRETGGQVLRAQPIQRDGREVYRVKVLTPQGRIRIVEEMPPPPRSDLPQRDDRQRNAMQRDEPQRGDRQRNDVQRDNPQRIDAQRDDRQRNLPQRNDRPVPNPPRNHRPE